MLTWGLILQFLHALIPVSATGHSMSGAAAAGSRLSVGVLPLSDLKDQAPGDF